MVLIGVESPEFVSVDSVPFTFVKGEVYFEFLEYIVFKWTKGVSCVYASTNIGGINSLTGIIFNPTTFEKMAEFEYRLNCVSNFFDLNLHVNESFRDSPLMIGHRGSGSNASGSRVRENTMLSFHRAAARLHGVELDVLLTRDNKLVVYHDLEFNGEPIANIDYSDIRGNRASSVNYIYEDPPLLDQVLKELTPAAGIVIELKYPTNATVKKFPAFAKYSRTEFVESVLNCIQKHPRNGWIILSSFDADICLILSKSLKFAKNVLVVHNVWFGHENEPEDNTVDFTDPRNRNPTNAIKQAQMIQGGIALEASFALANDLTRFEVPLFSYGKNNMIPDSVRKQAMKKLFGIFIDKLDLIKYSS